jgi:hypothetical protein
MHLVLKDYLSVPALPLMNCIPIAPSFVSWYVLASFPKVTTQSFVNLKAKNK